MSARTAPARVQVATPEEMRALAAEVAGGLTAGDLVVLTGPLGAGKTVFVQGLAAGLKVVGQVTSPTFVLARVHRPGPAGRVPLVHVDAYRLGGVPEIDDLDLDTDLADAVLAVEWGGGLVEGLTADRLEVAIDRASDTEVRTVELTGTGPRSRQAAARAACRPQAGRPH